MMQNKDRNARAFVRPARWLAVWCAAAWLFLQLPCAWAEVTVVPASVTFDALDQTASIEVMKDGRSLPGTDLRGWRLLASGHDYRHMFKFEKRGSILTLIPSESIEVGSYDLVIDTPHGSVTAKVYTPLRDLPDSLEKRAAAAGVSIDDLKKKLGLVSETIRETLSIELPPVYYQGQTLSLTMPLRLDRVYVWTMNGEVIKQGPGENHFAYTFKEPGEYVLVHYEQEDGIAVAVASAETTVAALPPVAWEVPQNVQFSLSGPAGYARYEWRIDGEPVSTEGTLTHTFRSPGQYTVECRASSPPGGPEEGFLIHRYDTTVK